MRNAAPGTVAFLGGTWALVTVMFFLRHALGYRDMLYDGIPCDPPWMPSVALSGVGGLTAFFAVLLLLPVPTNWAARRLWNLRPPWRQAAVLLAFVALVQLLLIPIHFGLLGTHDAVPHVVAGEDLDPDGPGDRFEVWEVFRDSERVHYLVQEKPTGPDAMPRRTVHSVPLDDVGKMKMVGMDRLFGILMEGQACSVVVVDPSGITSRPARERGHPARFDYRAANSEELDLKRQSSAATKVASEGLFQLLRRENFENMEHTAAHGQPVSWQHGGQNR